METTKKELELKFDSSTIEALGVKMYSQLPQALAELVANAYDADANTVSIQLYDLDKENKKIVVSDDGCGMSFEEINSKFLLIGRKRRKEDGENRKTPKGRIITGRKGLGKLALFGIGKNIAIETTKKGEPTATRFELNWDAILREKEGNYKPSTSFVDKEDPNFQGTTITLSELTRVSDFDLEAISVSLSKMFNFIDKNFQVQLGKNNIEPSIKLSRDLRYKGINHEFTWKISEIVKEIKDDYHHKQDLKGSIVSSAAGKTMPPHLRGITLYANGRLINTPSFFGLGESPHAFSYLSGWIDADFLDEDTEDVIATDRQSVRWDLAEPAALQKFLQKIIRYVENAWLEGRKANKRKLNAEKSGLDLNAWYKTFNNENMKKTVEKIVNKMGDNPDISSEDYSGVVQDLHQLIPEYPYYHWRHLHSMVQDASKEYYKNQDYYDSIQEAIKRYISVVRTKSGDQQSKERELMFKNFGFDDGKIKKLSVMSKYKKPDGTNFHQDTIQNIEDSQAHLSAGMVIGFRNPLAHEEKNHLRDSKALTEKDCLDALSILSYLFRRLDDA